jgi:predicted dehydrogenase
VSETDRKLRIGVLDCGLIAQAAHLESCVKARNFELFAICEVDCFSERDGTSRRV